MRALCRQGVVAAPGAFNALCARAIEQAGFPAVYVSGAGLANAVLGLPDVGLTTMSECVRHARTIAGTVEAPTIVDIDVGFGEAINVARTVAEMEAAGVAAVHLEDQELPKKCGHLDGKTLIPAPAMMEKIRAAAAARRDSGFVILARTDARGVEGFDAAVERAKCYVQAGADGLFPEALADSDEFARFAKAVGGLRTAGGDPPILLANMTEDGKSPLLQLSELAGMGYHVVIYPQTALRVAFGAIVPMLQSLRKDGSQTAWLDRMQRRRELYELLDYDGLQRIDRAVTGSDRTGEPRA
ncbi:MAG: methylisocitrate lyase [Phycisphaerae bacterium]